MKKKRTGKDLGNDNIFNRNSFLISKWNLIENKSIHIQGYNRCQLITSDKCACLKHQYSKIKTSISTYFYVIINLFVYFCVKNIMNLTILFTALYQKRGQYLYISSAHKIKKGCK